MTAQEVLLVVYLVLGPSRNIFLLKIGTKWPKNVKKTPQNHEFFAYIAFFSQTNVATATKTPVLSLTLPTIIFPKRLVFIVEIF